MQVADIRILEGVGGKIYREYTIEEHFQRYSRH